jgi:SAM-dependent methyltransferase
LERFDSDKFDLVFARDWVDRCRNPQQVIRQMLRVVKPGGFVLLEHRLGTAGQPGDGGLQRWVLSMESAARFDIRFQEDEIRMSHELGAACQIECERVNSGECWLIVKIRKNR